MKCRVVEEVGLCYERALQVGMAHIMVSWVSRSDAESAAFQEMFKDSDRGAALVAASFVEQFLEYKLRHMLRDDDETPLGEMFRSAGPLGSFSAKIHLAGC